MSIVKSSKPTKRFRLWKRFRTAADFRWNWTQAYFRILIIRLIERLQILFVRDTQKVEPLELVNVLGALSWIMPLTMTPNYLSTSIYFRQITKYVSDVQCLSLAWFLFAYWFLCFLFGGTPSGLINNRGQLVFWACARYVGLVMAMFVWLTVAQLLTKQGVTIGTVLFYAGGGISAGMFLLLCWRTIKEKQWRWLDASDQESPQGEMVEAAGR